LKQSADILTVKPLTKHNLAIAAPAIVDKIHPNSNKEKLTAAFSIQSDCSGLILHGSKPFLLHPTDSIVFSFRLDQFETIGYRYDKNLRLF